MEEIGSQLDFIPCNEVESANVESANCCDEENGVLIAKGDGVLKDVVAAPDDLGDISIELGCSDGLEELRVLDSIGGKPTQLNPIMQTPTKGSNNSAKDMVDSNVAPHVGMIFQTWPEVELMYKAYAKQQGFGVTRASGSFRNKTERRGITLRCECFGDPEAKAKWLAKKRAREMEIGVVQCLKLYPSKGGGKQKKCGCTAMVYASVNESSEWEIRKVILDHKNHNPTPSKAKLMKEYRMQHFSRSLRNRTCNGSDVGLSVGKIHRSFAKERDGIENMPFTEKDMRHVVDERRRLKMEGSDANSLFKYFQRMQKDNKDFFHTYRLDGIGRIKDILWVDARSRTAYEDFGDVVCFDSTYLTNDYKLPFANFVGVNHHGQSFLLGCALVSHEDYDTFKWIFSEWLDCMRGKAPQGILTDQAAAMRKPIEEVMLETRHRWCIWHILKKLRQKLGTHERYLQMKEELMAVIYDSFTPAEYERDWTALIEKYSLSQNEWLSGLFKEISMWVPTYMKDQFWAGMRTTQRVESINSFFDQFVTRHTKLAEFGEKYIAAVEKHISLEKEAYAYSVKWLHFLSTGFGIEKFFQKIYTDAKFMAVQRECERIIYCYVKEKMEVGINKLRYLVEDRVWASCKGGVHEWLTPKRRLYIVTFCSDTKEVECSCKMFETHGILCRHTIRILDQNLVDVPNEKYVLRRWRQDVPRKHSRVKVAYHDPARTLEVKKYDRMLSSFECICNQASHTDEATEIVLRAMKKVEKEVTDWYVKRKGQSECGLQTVGGQSMSCDISAIPGSQLSSYGGSANNVENMTPVSVSSVGSIKDPFLPKKRESKVNAVQVR